MKNIVKVERGGIYRNKKNRQLYKVIAIGRHTEPPNEGMVYYIPMYAPTSPEWTDCFRPLELFKEKFEAVEHD